MEDSTMDTYYRDAADRLLLTFQRIKRRERKRAEHLWSGEHGLMLYLCSCPEGVSAGKIAKDLHIGSGGVANLLNGLEKKGLIERSMSPTDRRSVIVCLTETGRSLMAERREQGRQRIVSDLKRLGKEDTESLLRIFERILTLEAEQEDGKC